MMDGRTHWLSLKKYANDKAQKLFRDGELFYALDNQETFLTFNIRLPVSISLRTFQSDIVKVSPSRHLISCVFAK